MRNLSIATAAALVALALAGSPAFAQQTANPPQSTNRINTTSHLGYVHQTANSDLFEIRSSQLALDKSKNREVRDFAQRMIHDHTDSSKQLEAAISEQHMTAHPPMELDVKQRNMMMRLNRLSGGEFDRVYMRMQVKGHEQALRLQEDYSRTGDNERFKQLAAQLVPMIRSHLDEARKIAGTETSSR